MDKTNKSEQGLKMYVVRVAVLARADMTPKQIREGLFEQISKDDLYLYGVQVQDVEHGMVEVLDATNEDGAVFK